MIHTLIAWGPAAIWAAVLFFLSEIEDTSLASWPVLNDKIVHVLLYGVMGTALAWGRIRGGRRLPHWVAITLGLAYGLSDEWHQSFVPGRSPSMGDALADLSGTVAGYALVTGLVWWHGKARPTRAA